MTHDEHREKLIEWAYGGERPAAHASLSSALYSLSELGVWPDSVDSVSTDQALLCWRVVEKLRHEKFPQSLKM